MSDEWREVSCTESWGWSSESARKTREQPTGRVINDVVLRVMNELRADGFQSIACSLDVLLEDCTLLQSRGETTKWPETLTPSACFVDGEVSADQFIGRLATRHEDASVSGTLGGIACEAFFRVDPRSHVFNVDVVCRKKITPAIGRVELEAIIRSWLSGAVQLGASLGAAAAMLDSLGGEPVLLWSFE